MRNELQAALEDAICYHELQAKSIQEAIGKTNHPRAVELYEDAKRYNETALTALRDMMRRRAGCEYCAVNDWERTPLATFYTYFNNYSKEQHEIGIDDYEGGYRIASTMNSNGLSIDIQFCPMCGRKLEVEG